MITENMPKQAGTWFVTGTGTGVGKTLFTGLLLAHLRQAGSHALALKPFCSGGRGDAEVLHSVQHADLSLEEVNPWSFERPLAPLIASRMEGSEVPFASAMEHILRMQGRCEVLLLEGAGGLLTPLGHGYSARDIIKALDCKVIIVARNRLGVINEVALTVEALDTGSTQRAKIVLMGGVPGDESVHTNESAIREVVGSEVLAFPELGPTSCAANQFLSTAKYFQKTLARVLV